MKCSTRSLYSKCLLSNITITITIHYLALSVIIVIKLYLVLHLNHIR